MEECPVCYSDEYEILEDATNFECGAVSMWWKCRCKKCKRLFEIVRQYNLDPYYSYVAPLDGEDW